jgi:hypothetical protein
MRIDGAEIKVTFADGQVEDAIRALELPAAPPPWQIYFCEDLTEGVSPATPLLDAGVILRARDKAGSSDTTVKLRPCRRSQLTDSWLAMKKDGDQELKLEADWAGDRRLLAASLSADRRGDLVARGVREGREVTGLFTAEQRDFLRDCASIRVNLATLTVLPGITAVRWKTVEAAPPGLDLRAERWTVGGLDFLELSTVAGIDEAPARQAALADYVRSLGVPVGADQEAKTGQVLRVLVRLALDR